MKTIAIQLFGLGLLFFGQPCRLLAQESAPCRDVLILKNRSRLEGQIEAFRLDDTLVFRLWSGQSLVVPPKHIKRIIQRCQDGKARDFSKPYNFKARGWYHFTRAQALTGQTYYGENSVGYALQHSSGYKFSRLIGVGLGAGIESIANDLELDVPSYPIFGEIRGYLLPRRITPFYAVGGGYAFAGKSSAQRWSYTDTWHGGWMAQAELGYRLGNHFIMYGGVRLQRKSRDWESTWNPEQDFGTDRILNKRLMLGVGILL